MKSFIHLLFFALTAMAATAQSVQSIFDWGSNAEILTKDRFRPLFPERFIVPNTLLPEVLTFKTDVVKTPKGERYTVRLHTITYPYEKERSYDGFSIMKGQQELLSYFSMDPLYNCASFTMGQSKAYFLQIPLDEERFALCFGGWDFGYDTAPPLVVVVVSGSQAQVVFDDHAYAYKYTPAPNFSIEYINYVDGVYEGPTPGVVTPAILKKNTKHRLWREGNVFKHKSWK